MEALNWQWKQQDDAVAQANGIDKTQLSKATASNRRNEFGRLNLSRT